MTVIGMHIRHNWPEWVTWTEQKTVKSACGVRTTPRMSGIPAVTPQPAFFMENGHPKLGWCLKCATITFRYLCPDGLDINGAPQAILDLHKQAKAELAPVVMWRLWDRLETVNWTRQPGLLNMTKVSLDEMIRNYPEALSTLRAVGFDIRK